MTKADNEITCNGEIDALLKEEKEENRLFLANEHTIVGNDTGFNIDELLVKLEQFPN